ncbi:MAG: Gfo/Idh/MocA family oxidoreductase, partial [Actinomycetota bacterium]
MPLIAAETKVSSWFSIPVAVASPTPLHAEMVQQALANNLHVLCEKPLALEVDLARQLAEQAKSRKLLLQIGH